MGKYFRFFVGFLLLGIFIELFVIIGILGGDPSHNGNIAIVEVNGVIENSSEVVRDLRRHTKRELTKAIVLRVDSPGGAVGASQEIHEAVLRAKKEKPVVVSMGNVAASGGYYVSAPSSWIVANPGTTMGSIGVIMSFFILDDLLKKAYLKWETISAGANKQIGSPLKELTPEERIILETMTKDVHDQFIMAVAEGRKIPKEDAAKIADGSIFSGSRAKDLKLVDELGSLETALDKAAKLAKIEDPRPIFPEKEKFGWLKKVAEGKLDMPFFKFEYRMK